MKDMVSSCRKVQAIMNDEGEGGASGRQGGTESDVPSSRIRAGPNIAYSSAGTEPPVVRIHASPAGRCAPTLSSTAYRQSRRRADGSISMLPSGAGGRW